MACTDCKKTVICDELQLPSTSNADFYTALRNRGKMLFVTVQMLEAFRVINAIMEKHFQPMGQIFVDVLWTHFKYASQKFQKLIFCHCSVKFIETMFSLM